MTQDLLTFEAVAVAAEAAKCDAQRAAEQQARDAKTAARIAKQEAKQAKTEDWRRKTSQARQYKTPDEHAQCGIHWYCRSPKDRDTGCYWHNCHKCGQKLIYTSERNAKPQVCTWQPG